MCLFLLDANTKPDKKELLNIIATELGERWQQVSILYYWKYLSSYIVYSLV